MSACLFSRYKNLFGEPGKGFHSLRLFNVAVLDTVGTYLISYLLAYFFTSKEKRFKYTLLIFTALMLLSLYLHRLFCVKTTLTKLFFFRDET